ncbi:MAG TPA: enoyl-CoA hydratase/isomerase family protein [Amycolatopsis sp.]|nr:enoyl-CoA hydratase/isomerase family protein [Amycolatopsis sp.]
MKLATPAAVEARLLDDDGQIVDPLLVVDLDTPDPAVIAAAQASDRLLIGLTTRSPASRELAAPLDVTVGPGTGPEFVVADPDTALPALHAAAAENPQAALALKQVLRAGTGDVPAGLDVESFAYSTLLGGPEFAAWLRRRGDRLLPPPAPQEPVLVDRDGARLLITLNRPERRNAYGRQLRDALVEALRLALLDPSIEDVVLTGAGPSFSAGGDLAEFGTTPDLATAHYVRTRGGAGRMLHQLADRVEVRVHGSCVGAGIELPAFAGRVVAHPDTTFRLPEVAMGLIPGAGGTASIPRRIGRWRTLFMALTGHPVDTATALEWGLIDAVSDS